MKTCLNMVLLVSCLIFLLAWFEPPEAQAGPYHSSNYVCLLDADSGQLIYSRNADELRPVASTTKMMTAILTMEYAELAEIVEISQKADHTPEYTIGLKEGQEVPVSELLKAALVKSSNDAAVALAEHVAGSERLFSFLMSKKAFLIGAVNTHFVNASGLPAEEHWSTAYDLSLMGRYLLRTEYINELAAARQVEFKHPGYGQELTISNTNGLLGSYEGANGIKTGTTNAAGKCLVASARRNHRQLIAVALNSLDRNGDCARLLNYGYGDVSREKIIDSREVFKQIKIVRGGAEYLDLYPEKDLYIWRAREENGLNVEKKVEMDYSISAPIRNNQPLGMLYVYVDGKLFDSIRLVSRSETGQNSPGLIKLKEIFH